MIQRIGLMLEALSIIICLHHLYGVKFKLDMATVTLLAIDMIMMQTIDYYGWSSTLSVLIYPIIVLYCVVEFGREIKKLVINNILYLVIMSSLQFGVVLVFYYLLNKQIVNDMDVLIANAFVLAVVFFLLPKCKLNMLSKYLQDRQRILIMAMIISILFTMFGLFNLKRINSLGLYQYVILFIGIITIALLAVQLGRYKVKSKEIETELKMHRLYADSFQSLIDNIRLRQHEFNNHINTIYSQHYMCGTYEELVNAQKEYCQVIERDNRYNSLLAAGNPIVIGFLYGKFIEIEKHGIEITYSVSMENFSLKIPIYRLVEIMGDIINNAVEAVECLERKEIFLSLVETGGSFTVEIRNISPIISFTEIERFFHKGYSKKGINRGLGLYNVRKICEEYNLDISCENRIINEDNWLVFIIK